MPPTTTTTTVTTSPLRPPPPSPRQRRRGAAPEGIRITTVGLWYVLLSLMVAIASTNTGNNALYAVLAVLFAVLILSGLLSRQNVRGLAIELAAPAEVFANRPFDVSFTLRNRGWLLPRWFLLLRLARDARPLLVPHLPRRGRSSGRIETMVPRRGPCRFPFAHVSSLFPFGFFRKGVRYHADLAVLVFPEIFPAAGRRLDDAEAFGDDAARRPGWGHALFSLRGFRRGDDPRGIHWKQTARTGAMVYMEREAEQVRRLSIVFDNGVGKLADGALRERFELFFNDAATTAVDHLARGYEVELVTRDRTLAFAAGHRQRLAVLELLALVEPGPRRRSPLLASDPRSPQLRIHLDAGEATAATSTVPERWVPAPLRSAQPPRSVAAPQPPRSPAPAERRPPA